MVVVVLYLSRAKDNLSKADELTIILINKGKITMKTNLVTLVKFDRTKFETYAKAKLNNAVKTPSSQRTAWTLSTENSSELMELISMYRDVTSDKSYFGLVVDDEFFPLESKLALTRLLTPPYLSMVA